jgi:hypothetical protein
LKVLKLEDLDGSEYGIGFNGKVSDERDNEVVVEGNVRNLKKSSIP